MAWSFSGLSVKEMTDPMLHGAMDELRAELGCRKTEARDDERGHFTQRNEGSSTSFYSCGICGASVQPMDRETHIEWHRRVS